MSSLFGQARTEALRIGTFNVRWADPNDGAHRWDRRRSRFLGLLRTWEPDILGLQEPLQSQLDEIRQALPEYKSAGVGRDDGREAGEFCPIFYRSDRFELADEETFWFSETPETPGSRGWGSGHPRLCTWVRLQERPSGRARKNEQAFYVYNLHWDHESQIARENSAYLLLDRISRRPVPGPVIVLGDFNAEADNPALARLTASDLPALKSALLSEHPLQSSHPPYSGTFHGFTGEALGTPIDHIFLSPEWRVLRAEVLHGDGGRPFPSDHFPVAVTLDADVPL